MFPQDQHTDSSCSQYAAVMGLNKDLRLHGNEFSNTATAFFAAYLIAEIPTGGKYEGYKQFLFLTRCCSNSAVSVAGSRVSQYRHLQLEPLSLTSGEIVFP